MTETQINIELILATITDGIVVVNQHGIVLYANQSAEHILNAAICRAVIWPSPSLMQLPIKTST